MTTRQHRRPGRNVAAMARRSRISLRGIVTTAVVAVVVVLGYDKYKHSTAGPVAGARPGSYA